MNKKEVALKLLNETKEKELMAQMRLLEKGIKKFNCWQKLTMKLERP